VNAYDLDELCGVNIKDYSLAGTSNMASMLVAASVSVEAIYGSKSVAAAEINAAHEAESAALKGMIRLQCVLGRKVVA